MGANFFVRKTFNAVALRKEVNKYLDPKITSLRKDKTLANMIATKWGEAVTPFVPRSDLDIPENKHLQSFHVSDGRVIWTRKAESLDSQTSLLEGEEIAYLLYEGAINGHFHSRYAGHNPQPHWDECVTPGTGAWDDFVTDITPSIIDWVKNNG